VTVLAAVIVTVQTAPLTDAHPAQLRKTESGGVGSAVSCALAPGGNCAPQLAALDPQSTPSPETEPVPPPTLVFFTSSLKPANLAVTVLAPSTATVQDGALAGAHPVQPAKAEPGSGFAVSVTVVPAGKLAPQALAQSIPVGSLATLPRPVPVASVVTLTLNEANVAVAVLAAVMTTVQTLPIAVAHPVHTVPRPGPGLEVSVTLCPAG
jgi:hypothetical protein